MKSDMELCVFNWSIVSMAKVIQPQIWASKIPVDTKWIVFGGSYSGSLAAWPCIRIRCKYPHLVHGAVSSSGSLLAQIDFQQYFVIVENSLKINFQACVDVISSANTQIHSVISHRIGQQNLGEKFNEIFSIDFFIQQCTDIFGPKYDMHLLANAVERTNIVYGGLHLEVSNVVYVHGSIDPWHALGITKSSNPQALAIYINGTAHCVDMYPARAINLPELVSARQKIGYLIGQWLK